MGVRRVVLRARLDADPRGCRAMSRAQVRQANGGAPVMLCDAARQAHEGTVQCCTRRSGGPTGAREQAREQCQSQSQGPSHCRRVQIAHVAPAWDTHRTELVNLLEECW